MSRIETEPIPPRDRLIFALDVLEFERAASLIDTLGDAVTFYKVGLELILSRDFVRVIDRLHERGKNLFVDGKLYDVPQTVEAAVRQLTVAGARFTSVHGTGPLLEAACRVRDEAGGDLRILAVTAFTSVDKNDSIALGYGPDLEVERLVLARAGHALNRGRDRGLA